MPVFAKKSPPLVEFRRIGLLFLLQACMDPDQSSSSGQSVAQGPWCRNVQELPAVYRAVINNDISEVLLMLYEGKYSNDPCRLIVEKSGLGIAITLSPPALAIELGLPELVELLKEEVVFDEKVRLHIGGRTAAVPVLCQCIQAIRFPSVASMKDNFYAAKHDRLAERMHIFKRLVEELKRREEGEEFKKIRDEALHYAVLCGSVAAKVKEAIQEVILALLNQGAQLPKEVPVFAEAKQWIRNSHGKFFHEHSPKKNTGLHVCLIEGNSSILKILINYAPDKELLITKNAKGITPRDYLSSWINDIQNLVKCCTELCKKHRLPMLQEAVRKLHMLLTHYQEAVASSLQSRVHHGNQEPVAGSHDAGYNPGLASFQALWAVDSPITILQDLENMLTSADHAIYLNQCGAYQAALKRCRASLSHCINRS